MPNAPIQTVENANSVADFIKTVPDETKQADSFAIVEIMKRLSGFEAKMWGPAIIGFGRYHYRYDSGREGEMPLVAFSPRKASITLYLSSEFPQREELLQVFGKHKTSKACIYFKKLKDINIDVLEKMIANSLNHPKAG